MRALLFSFVILAIALCGRAAADVVVMQNGDRITGDISQIWGDDLKIEPDYTDEFVIEMDKVAYVQSDRDFDLTLADGREVTARFTGASPDGKQSVVYDNQTHTVPVTDIKQVLETDTGELDWESHIDWSSTVTSGNSDSRVAHLTGDAEIEIGDHRHIATILIADEEVANVKTKDQDFVTYSYNWLFSDKWFLGAGASYESDPIKQLDQRTILGVGIGRDIWDRHNRRMNFEIGVGSLDETLAGVDETNSIAYWKFRFSYEFSGTDLEIYHNNQINTHLSGRDNTFAKFSTGLRYEITDLFYLTMSLNTDYETDPAPGTKKEDTTWVLGAGFEF